MGRAERTTEAARSALKEFKIMKTERRRIAKLKLTIAAGSVCSNRLIDHSRPSELERVKKEKQTHLQHIKNNVTVMKNKNQNLVMGPLQAILAILQQILKTHQMTRKYVAIP
jgi:hypothetical protein